MPPGSRVFWRPCSLSWTCVLRPNRTSAESVCCRAPHPSCLPPARDQPEHPGDMAWRRESPAAGGTGLKRSLTFCKTRLLYMSFQATFSGASRLCTCHASGPCDGQCPERICAFHEYSAAPAHRASAAYSARCGTGGASGCSCPWRCSSFLTGWRFSAWTASEVHGRLSQKPCHSRKVRPQCLVEVSLLSRHV